MKWVSNGLLTLFVGLSVYSNAAVAHARELCPEGQFKGLCNIKIENSGGIIGTIVTVLLIIAIVTSLFFMIYGAFRWTTSGGDKGKVDQARSTLVASIVGLVIALLAFFIMNTVLFIFTGKGMTELSIPKL